MRTPSAPEAGQGGAKALPTIIIAGTAGQQPYDFSAEPYVFLDSFVASLVATTVTGRLK